MACRTRRAARFAFAGLFLVFCSATLLHAQDVPSEVRTAKKLIESEARTILFLAHPTVKCNDVVFEGYKKKGKEYVVTYTFNWSMVTEHKGHTTLALTFNDDGTYVDCKNKATSGLVLPFFSTDTLLNKVRPTILKNPRVANNKQLCELVSEMDARSTLRAYMHYKQGADNEDIRAAIQIVMKALGGQ